MRRAMAIAACAIWLGGCATAAPTPTPQPTTGPCDPIEIRLVAGRSGAAAGSMILTFSTVLTEGPPCLILTWPSVAIRDGVGAIVIQSEDETTLHTSTTTLSSSLEFHLAWASQCGPLPPGPYSAEVYLFDEGAALLALPAGFGPSGCNGGPAVVGVEPGWNYSP